jgi:hypothetical protein
MPVAEPSAHRRANARQLLLCVAAVMLCALLLPVAASAAAPTASKPAVAPNGVVRVTVTAPGAGIAEVSARRLATSPVGLLCATSATFSAAGESQTLLCKPTATAVKLGRRGAMRWEVTLAFTPTGGSKETSSLGVVVVPRLAEPTATATDLKLRRDGTFSVVVSSTGPGTAVVTGTNVEGPMCIAEATLATTGSTALTCAFTPRGAFLHKGGNMFEDVSLQFTPAGGTPTTSVVGRLLVPMA